MNAAEIIHITRCDAQTVQCKVMTVHSQRAARVPVRRPRRTQLTNAGSAPMLGQGAEAASSWGCSHEGHRRFARLLDLARMFEEIRQLLR